MVCVEFSVGLSPIYYALNYRGENVSQYLCREGGRWSDLAWRGGGGNGGEDNT